MQKNKYCFKNTTVVTNDNILKTINVTGKLFIAVAGFTEFLKKERGRRKILV